MQFGHHSLEKIFKCIFLKKKGFVLDLIENRSHGSNQNNPATIQMTCFKTGNKPSSQAMMAYFSHAYMHD